MENVKTIAEIEQRSKSNTRRIEALEQEQAQIHDLVTSVALIAQKQNDIETSISEIKKDVKSITEKPAKWWDSVTMHIVTTIVGALVMYLLVRLGIG